MKALKILSPYFLLLIIISSCEKRDDENLKPKSSADNETIHSQLSDFSSKKSILKSQQVEFSIDPEDMSSEFPDFCGTYFSNYPENQIKAEYNSETNKFDITTVVPAPDSTLPSGDLRKQICWSSYYLETYNCLQRHERFAIGFDNCAYGYRVRYNPQGDIVAYQGFVDCP